MLSTTKRDPIQWDLSDIKAAACLLRAINHRLRRRIIDELYEGIGSLTVTDLYIRLRLDQSTCSQHLSILRKAGIIDADRQGKFVYYSVNYEMLGRAQETLKFFKK